MSKSKRQFSCRLERRVPLGQLLIELGHITKKDLNAALAAQAGMETRDLEHIEIPESVVHILPAETAKGLSGYPAEIRAGHQYAHGRAERRQ